MNFRFRSGILVLSAVLLCSLFGCQNSGDSVAQISTFLQVYYGGPTEEQQEILLKNLSEEDVVTQYQDTLESELNPENFTSDFYSSLGNDLLVNRIFPQLCAINGYTLFPRNIQVKEESSFQGLHEYVYSLDIEIVKDKETITTVEESGGIQINQDGKISKITPDLEELTKIILQ